MLRVNANKSRRPRGRSAPRPESRTPATRPRPAADAVLIAVNKPYGVLCQFTDGAGRPTLADLIDAPGCYPAGRLDRDSEGLVLLTDDGRLQQRIADPRFKRWKTYWVQVEGIPAEETLAQLRRGVQLSDGPTLPARAERMDEPADLWPRDPPIRYRAAIPSSWIRMEIREGRNRQVRRMTAAVGHPTLRLIRWAIGEIELGGMRPGEWRTEEREKIKEES